MNQILGLLVQLALMFNYAKPRLIVDLYRPVWMLNG